MQNIISNVDITQFKTLVLNIDAEINDDLAVVSGFILKHGDMDYLRGIRGDIVISLDDKITKEAAQRLIPILHPKGEVKVK